MYPAGVNKRSKIFVPGINEIADCRAYPVFHEYIEPLCNKLKCDVDDVFLCKPITKDGVKGAEVFSCSMCCDNKAKYNPQSREYDLFDGVKPDETARGTFQSIGEYPSPSPALLLMIDLNTFCLVSGIGEKPPPELSCLTIEDRLRLAVLKVCCALLTYNLIMHTSS